MSHTHTFKNKHYFSDFFCEIKFNLLLKFKSTHKFMTE